MLNNEVRSILEQQYSMERNYERIIKKVENNKIPSFKILKFTLIPICIMILAIVTITNKNEKEEVQFKQIIEISFNKDKENDELLDRQMNLDSSKIIKYDNDLQNKENIIILKIKVIEENKKAELIEYIKGNDVDIENKKIYIENKKLEEGKEYTIFIDKENYNIVKVEE
ncbi:MAG: hypothetical protein J6M60_01785 [Clostridia bacterium]|nr:hypothetical protein [Clostridia bacterium]